MGKNTSFSVAVIGAGPAGLFAARKLAENGVYVAILNRDVKPGGLAEYGIYPSKLKMKRALREQFKQILSSPQIAYFGNVAVCRENNPTLMDLLEAGFHAVLVTTGAQGTKWQYLPGENLPGVYHAKSLVYHYNRFPPFSQRKFLVGRRAAIVGAGNVMLDIARYLLQVRKVEEVIAVARRGPAEVKFTQKELESLAPNVDMEALNTEFDRLSPILRAVGQDLSAIRQRFQHVPPYTTNEIPHGRLRFEFLASPVRVLGDWINGISALKVEDNTLVLSDGQVRAQGTGNTRLVEVDTVIFAIGDVVDRNFCLPVYGNAYLTAEEPRFSVQGISFEACQAENNTPIEGVFLAGWARQPSVGLVGQARKDGEMAVEAILQYLNTRRPSPDAEELLRKLERRLMDTQMHVVRKDDLTRLDEAERQQAIRLGMDDFKFPTNEEMFQAMGMG